jgi:O-antigen/teichoic acid export membrane protein
MGINHIFTRLLPRGSNSRNSVLVVIGDGITFTSVFITSMILARIIPVDAMATYRQVLYLGGLAQSIVEFGLSSSIYRFWNLLDEQGRSTYIKMQLMLSMSLGLLASLVLAILAPFLAVWFHNPDLKLAMLICCTSPLVNIVPLTIRPVMICRGKPLWATSIALLFALAMVAAIIIPFTLGANLNQALIFWMLVNLIEVFLTFIILRPEILPGTPWWDRNFFRDTWNYLWPIQAGRIPGLVTTYTDKIATSIFLPVESFAAYSLGARELPFIGGIGSSISSVLIPSLVLDIEAGRIDEACQRWKRACERTSLLTYPIIGFCIWFCEPLVRFLYSSKYSSSSIPFAIYAAITFVRVIEYASLAKAFGKTDMIMKAAFSGTLTVLLFAFPFTIWFGIWGASFTVLLAICVSVGYWLFSYTKMLNRSLSSFYPWKRLLIMGLASIACAAIAGTLLEPIFHLSKSNDILDAGIRLAIFFAFDLVLYLVVLFGVRILRLEQIRQIIKKSSNT